MTRTLITWTRDYEWTIGDILTRDDTLRLCGLTLSALPALRQARLRALADPHYQAYRSRHPIMHPSVRSYVLAQSLDYHLFAG